jgi:hypothetical protein
MYLYICTYTELRRRSPHKPEPDPVVLSKVVKHTCGSNCLCSSCSGCGTSLQVTNQALNQHTDHAQFTDVHLAVKRQVLCFVCVVEVAKAPCWMTVHVLSYSKGALASLWFGNCLDYNQTNIILRQDGLHTRYNCHIL